VSKGRSTAPPGNSLLAHLVTAALTYQNLSGLEGATTDGIHRAARERSGDVSSRAREIHGSTEFLHEIIRGRVVTLLGLREDVPGQRDAIARMAEIAPALRSSARAIARDIERVIGAPDEPRRQAAVEQFATDVLTFREMRNEMRTAASVLAVSLAPSGFSLLHPVVTSLNHQYLDWLEMANRGEMLAKSPEQWRELSKRAREVVGNAQTLSAMLSGRLVNALALQGAPEKRNAISPMVKLAPLLSHRAVAVAEGIEAVVAAPNKASRQRAVRQLAEDLKALKRTRGEMWTYAAVFEPVSMNKLERQNPEIAKALREGTYQGGFEPEAAQPAKRRAPAPARAPMRPAPAAQVVT